MSRIFASETLEVAAAALDGPAALRRIWSPLAPLEVEVGCGKGRFIIHCAETMPTTRFLAIERARRYFRIALKRANRRGLGNLRLVCTDAVDLMESALPAGSVRAVHVLFPDPWPKKRHHKRRVFQPRFVSAVVNCLEDGGQLNVATDHADYFEAISATVDANPGLRREASFALVDRLPEGAAGHTNFEVKYRAAGRAIHQQTWSRLPWP